MKIDILSMQRVYNYGSFLQAYGLKKLIENKGNHTVSFIDIEQGDHEGVRVEKGTTLADHKRTFDKYSFRRLIYKLRADKRNQMFEEKRKSILKLTDEICTSISCDMAIIGSDEVFNCNKANPYGISLQLFGKIDCAKKVASYAASCGYTDYGDVPKEYIKPIADSLSGMENISVRDANTADFVEKLCGIKPVINLDPVLMYNFSEEVAKAEKEINFPKKYVVVYAYKNRFKDSELIDTVKKYAKKNKMKIISLGDSQYWADDFKVLTPFELLAYFKNAECVLTDTFHGTIFSSKFHKRVGVVVRESNKNKLLDLVNRVGISDHLIYSNKEIVEKLDFVGDYSSFDSIIKENRQKTQEYLDGLGL